MLLPHSEALSKGFIGKSGEVGWWVGGEQHRRAPVVVPEDVRQGQNVRAATAPLVGGHAALGEHTVGHGEKEKREEEQQNSVLSGRHVE